MPRRPKPVVSLPGREELLAFIRASAHPVGAREIARAFRIKGAELRIELKELLARLEHEGAIERHRGRRVAAVGALPPAAIIEVTALDEDGELLARPVVWHARGAPPKIFVAPERHGTPAIEVGTRLLARLSRAPDGTYEAIPVRVIAGRPAEVVGVLSLTPGGGWIRSTDRRHRDEFFVPLAETRGARDGELVRAEIEPHRRMGRRRARIRERIGHAEDPGAISLIAIHSHDIPVEFPRPALDEASSARPCPLDGRSDLRRLPLVTIDGPDARDFDDAVWAEPDPDPRNRHGWHLVVAIADVGYYVRPDSALDRAAFERGNSVYFPDRVVPMLPEALSNLLCSLQPHQDRACLAAHIWIDAAGSKLRHRFERGLMRSKARLTYEQVQRARDGAPDETTRPLLEPVIAPLYGAFASLLEARRRRGTLDLDLPERKVIFAAPGKIERIVPAERFDSHRLIEEFMIAANVAAAEVLEETGQATMYRIHDRPDPDKVEALREFLGGLGYRFPKGQVIQPRHFTGILAQARQRGHEHLVSELVLRTQAQARYAPENIGHFGLALRRYCHFTSPIRRYADLLVHRGLISGLRFGPDGLRPGDGERFPEAGEHISATERRAAAAERDALDRYTVAFLEDRVGDTFYGRVTGVTRFGLFVRLEETGADGLVPIRSLADDYYIHDEARHSLVGRRAGRTFRLGEPAVVRLVEADPITGGLLFDLAESDGEDVRATPPVRRPAAPGIRRPRRGHGARRRRPQG